MKKIIIASFLSIVSLFVFSNIALATGGFNKAAVFRGVNLPKNNADDKVVQNVFQQVFFWAGVIAVIAIMVSGLYYTISSGDSGKISKAKNALIYSVVGLLISIFSYAIVTFVLGVIK